MIFQHFCSDFEILSKNAWCSGFEREVDKGYFNNVNDCYEQCKRYTLFYFEKSGVGCSSAGCKCACVNGECDVTADHDFDIYRVKAGKKYVILIYIKERNLRFPYMLISSFHTN